MTLAWSLQQSQLDALLDPKFEIVRGRWWSARSGASRPIEAQRRYLSLAQFRANISFCPTRAGQPVLAQAYRQDFQRRISRERL